MNLHRRLKRPLRIVVGLVLCGLFIGLVASASIHQNEQPITGVRINILNESAIHPLLKKNLKEWIFKNPQLTVVGKPTTKIDLKKIESKTSLNPWVAETNAFIDNQSLLQINVTERKPVAQIFSFNNRTFYLDSTLAELPPIQGVNFSLPIFTGVIYGKNDSLNKAVNKAICYLAKIIGQDSFWNAQIQQIVVQPDNTFVLIPLLGKNQRIIFGDTAHTKTKLDNLMAFYKHVVPKVGWAAYRKIDLRFKGQIVASPTLGVTIPKVKDPLAKRVDDAIGKGNIKFIKTTSHHP